MTGLDDLFADPRPLPGGGSVVTCKACGALVADTQVHHDAIVSFVGEVRAHCEAVRERDRAWSAMSRARALLDQWVSIEGHGTHSGFCYQFHPDCLVRVVTAALEEDT